MSIGVEGVVIGVVVLGAAIWAIRSAYFSVRNNGGCSSCASSGECPLVNNPQALAELSQKGRVTPPEPCPKDPAAGAEPRCSLEPGGRS